MKELRDKYESYLGHKAQFEKENAVFEARREDLIKKIVEECSNGNIVGFELDPERLTDQIYVEQKVEELNTLLMMYKADIESELAKIQ